MNASLEQIKKLRETTSLGVSDCRKALEDSKGDLPRALEILKKRSLEIAAKKADRAAGAGRVVSYVHFDNKVGVLVEINSETDFAARNEEFVKFSSDVALHIAAMGPKYVKREEVPAETAKEQPDVESFYKQSCLLEQAFVKNPSLTIKDYLNSLIGKIGENILIRRFVRFQLGQ
ncbi:MAG: elongation factor Ts [Candidatus Omnitrophota bacterium]|nr:elongation factor Ts [Candidatus Omnitrophota bacterium]